MRAGIATSALIAGLVAPGAGAQTVGEDLIQPLPAGFHQVQAATATGLSMAEYVAGSETAEAWTVMITTQQFLGKAALEPTDFLQALAGHWSADCPGAQADPVVDSQANGLKVSEIYLACPNNPLTHKPEHTLFRALQGTENFYLVQYAFQAEPTKAQLDTARAYLATVKVCNSAGHACPAAKSKPD